MTFVMAFHHDWRNRGETGMVGTVIGMKTPLNGRIGYSRQETGSDGDYFKMFKTIRVNRESCH